MRHSEECSVALDLLIKSKNEKKKKTTKKRG